MRGGPADGTAGGLVARGPSRRPVPSWDQDVVTGPAVEDVHAPVPDQLVVAGPAEEGVVAWRADQDVVAGAAVRREPDGAGRQGRGVHRVVAGQGVDRQP